MARVTPRSNARKAMYQQNKNTAKTKQDQNKKVEELKRTKKKGDNSKTERRSCV
jgi:hypothetical protein